MNRHLHIVCIDKLWPPEYGAAIDMMNRMIALQQSGVGIHLHYSNFKDKLIPNEINQYCESIEVYEQKDESFAFCMNSLYKIPSRNDSRLVDNLNRDHHPLLLEGLPVAGIIPHLDLRERKAVVRVHNEANSYHKELEYSEKNWFRRLLHKKGLWAHACNDQLPNGCVYACTSEAEAADLQKNNQLTNVRVLPVYPSWQKVCGEEGAGKLCLYHGNLSVPENEEAAIWLLQKVFSKINIPFVIAGRKPSRKLAKQAHLYEHSCLIADPSGSELNDLVRKAHVHVLPSFNREENCVRLRLLHALFEGRHCLVNPQMVRGTGLEEACHVGGTARDFASIISQLYYRQFTVDELTLRRKLLGDTYDNEKNTKELIQWLW